MRKEREGSGDETFECMIYSEVQCACVCGRAERMTRKGGIERNGGREELGRCACEGAREGGVRMKPRAAVAVDFLPSMHPALLPVIISLACGMFTKGLNY